MRRYLVLVVFFIFTSCKSYCFGIKEFNGYLEKEIKAFTKKNGTTGLAIGVIKSSYDMEKPFCKIFTFGDSQKFPKITVKDTTVFRIGGVSQLFLGILLAKAIGDNLIELDQKASKYLPRSFNLSKYHDDEITVKDLAYHISSLPNEPISIYKRYQVSIHEMSNHLKLYKLPKKPGTRFEKSDLGYSILAQCLSRVNRDRIDRILKKDIFDELGMEMSSLKEFKEQYSKLATGYRGIKVVSGERVDKGYSFFSAAAGILTTASDMQRLMKFFLRIEDSKLSKYLKVFYGNSFLLPDQFIEKIAFGPKLSNLSFSSSLQTYKISSEYHGFSTSVVFIPDTSTSVFVLSNSEDSTEDLALKLLSELNN